MLFILQLPDVSQFCPCRQNNILFSHSIMQQLKLLRRGSRGTMTIFIRLERTAALSLLVMTTWNSTISPFFILMWPVAFDVLRFSPAKCDALHSHPVRYIIYFVLRKKKSLTTASFSLDRVICALIAGNTQLFNHLLIIKYTKYTACCFCKTKTQSEVGWSLNNK